MYASRTRGVRVLPGIKRISNPELDEGLEHLLSRSEASRNPKIPWRKTVFFGTVSKSERLRAKGKNANFGIFPLIYPSKTDNGFSLQRSPENACFCVAKTSFCECKNSLKVAFARKNAKYSFCAAKTKHFAQQRKHLKYLAE